MTLTFWSDQARLTEFLQPEFTQLIAFIWMSFSLFLLSSIPINWKFGIKK